MHRACRDEEPVMAEVTDAQKLKADLRLAQKKLEEHGFMVSKDR